MTSDEGAAVIDAPGAPSVPDILVRVEHVAKAFGPTQALRDCSFELRAGEVHALAGENGSGKSTLVKILSGVHLPDSGRVEVGGAEAQLRSPKAAQEHGIVTVFQEVLVAEARSVLDNVWLGADDIWRTKVPAREKRRLAKAALEELLDRPVDLSTVVEDLSLSERQACCIVRALLRRQARLADHLYLVFSAPPEGLGNDEFVAWYREHADENTQVEGFLTNWRFRLEPEVIDPSSATVATHLAVYEVDRDLAALRANLDAARVTDEAGWPPWFDPTPWTSLDAIAIGDRVPAPARS